jgi:hypothetical protein
LRDLVDARTAGVPVVRQHVDPEAPPALAAALRRERRRTAVGVSVLAVCLAVVVTALVGAALSGAGRVERTVDAATPVRLDNGTTVAIVGEPELIEHYTATIANLYAIQVRMCGGRITGEAYAGLEPRNSFAAEAFTLKVDDLAPREYPVVRERPRPPLGHLDKGECAAGWLVYQLPRPTWQAATLEYTNGELDRVTWRLPSAPARSPLSKPCPSPTRNAYGQLAVEPWAGCPGVTPSPSPR